MNINQSNLNHSTLQFNLFDIASDVKSLEIRERDAYVFECVSKNMVNEIINHGFHHRRCGTDYIPSSYVLYQLPNNDYAYVFVTYRIYKSLILCLNEEYYFKVIKYIPGDSPKQLSNVLNTIIDRISNELYLKKESRAVQKLVTENKNLTQQLSTLKASYDYKEMMKIKDENAALERAIKKLIKQHDKLKETHKALIMEFYSLTYTFKQRFSFFLKAFIRLFE